MVSEIIKVEEVLLAEPKAEADNTNQDLDYSGYHKKIEPNNCFIIHCIEENKDKHSIAWNTVWHCSLKSCIVRATCRLVTNLLAVTN